MTIVGPRRASGIQCKGIEQLINRRGTHAIRGTHCRFSNPSNVRKLGAVTSRHVPSPSDISDLLVYRFESYRVSGARCSQQWRAAGEVPPALVMRKISTDRRVAAITRYVTCHLTNPLEHFEIVPCPRPTNQLDQSRTQLAS